MCNRQDLTIPLKLPNWCSPIPYTHHYLYRRLSPDGVAIVHACWPAPDLLLSITQCIETGTELPTASCTPPEAQLTAHLTRPYNTDRIGLAWFNTSTKERGNDRVGTLFVDHRRGFQAYRWWGTWWRTAHDSTSMLTGLPSQQPNAASPKPSRLLCASSLMFCIHSASIQASIAASSTSSGSLRK